MKIHPQNSSGERSKLRVSEHVERRATDPAPDSLGQAPLRKTVKTVTAGNFFFRNRHRNAELK